MGTTKEPAGMSQTIKSNSNFPTTDWMTFRRGDVDLAKIYTRYAPAICQYITRRWRLGAAAVDDLLQGFVLSQLIERDLIARADPARGRFRALLITALNRYVGRQLSKVSVPPLGGINDATNEISAPVGKGADCFEAEWARQIFGEALNRMRQRCESDGRPDLWTIFEMRLLRPILSHQPAISYQELREQFGLQSVSQTANLLTTAKKMYIRAMRSVIEEYASSEEEVDAEIMDLINVLTDPRA